MYFEWWEVILLGILLTIMGISIGQILGQNSMKPIIKSYQGAIEGYKHTLEYTHKAHKEIVIEYKKTISILRAYNK